MGTILIVDPLAIDAKTRAKVDDPDYWRGLNPGFSISENPFDTSREPYPIDPEEVQRNLASFRHDGYCSTIPIIPEEQCDRLAGCILNVLKAGHHQCYALVYDEFYQLVVDLSNLLTPLLGENYQFVPDEFGTYYILPDDDNRGTPPHKDNLHISQGILPSGLPKIANFWVALSDATPLNSCMYVIPAHLDPTFPRYGKARATERGNFRIELNHVRALPAKKGSVLSWSPQLLHWGGRSSKLGKNPRISYAFYCQNRSVDKYHEVTTDIPVDIPFARRIELIEKVWRKNLTPDTAKA